MMPSVVADILDRARGRRVQPVPLDWYLAQLNHVSSGMGALEFELEIPDAARELRRALDSGAYREALTTLVMIVRMVRCTVEQRAELGLPPTNREVVRSLLGSTEELEWMHGDDNELPRTLIFLLDEALVADTERALGEEDPRVAEYWRLYGEWLHLYSEYDRGERPDDERPEWPDDLDPTVPRPGLPLSFLCTAHAWALAAVLRGCSSLRRGGHIVDPELLPPLARALDLLRRLDDEHDRSIAGGHGHNDGDLSMALDVLARVRISLERIVAAYLATLYGLEPLEFVPSLWLEGEMTSTGGAPGGGELRVASPVTATARAVTRSLAGRDRVGAVRELARTCTAAADALRSEDVIPAHRRSTVADTVRTVANDIAWGMNRIQEAWGVSTSIAAVTRFLRHVEGRTDNSYGSPIAWTGDTDRLMAEDHLLAIADALDPQMAGEVGFCPNRDSFGSIPVELSQGAALSRARALLRRYDAPLSPDGLGGDWGEDEGAQVLEALRDLALTREALGEAIDAVIARENQDMSAFTDGHVLWGTGMAVVPRLEETTGTVPPPTQENPNIIRLGDGTGTLHDVYPRFIDRAFDIIEERGDDIRPLGTSGSGEIVLEINGRVVTAHRNLDYYSCSCEDSHYRSADDRHLCKHMVVAAILFGDFELREGRHLRRAETLFTRLSDIRERLLAERGERADHLRQVVLRQLAERTDRDEIDLPQRHLRQRQDELQHRIHMLEIERIETPLRHRERRLELRRDMERLIAELESVRTQLEWARPASRGPRPVPMGRGLVVLEEQRENLRTRIRELQANIEEIHARIRGVGPEVLERNERQDLMNHQSALEVDLARSTHLLEATQRQIQRFEAHGRSGPVTRAEVRAPPGLWECAPPGEGG